MKALINFNCAKMDCATKTNEQISTSQKVKNLNSQTTTKAKNWQNGTIEKLLKHAKPEQHRNTKSVENIKRVNLKNNKIARKLHDWKKNRIHQKVEN